MSGDHIATKCLSGLTLQENGIIRNREGVIIARLSNDIEFNSTAIAIHVDRFEPVIDTCHAGHNYAKLKDHPRNQHGDLICPHCVVNGKNRLQKMFDWFVNWYVEGGKRSDIIEDGHIRVYTKHDVVASIERQALK